MPDPNAHPDHGGCNPCPACPYAIGPDDRREPHDAHVEAARAVFRASGFTLAAMQFKRSPGSLAALKRFNGIPDTMEVPFAWHYHPSAWSAEHSRVRV